MSLLNALKVEWRPNALSMMSIIGFFALFALCSFSIKHFCSLAGKEHFRTLSALGTLGRREECTFG